MDFNSGNNLVVVLMESDANDGVEGIVGESSDDTEDLDDRLLCLNNFNLDFGRLNEFILRIVYV